MKLTLRMRVLRVHPLGNFTREQFQAVLGEEPENGIMDARAVSALAALPECTGAQVFLHAIDDGSEAARQLAAPEPGTLGKWRHAPGGDFELLVARRELAGVLLPGRIVHVELEALEPVERTVTPELVECAGGPLAVGGSSAGAAVSFAPPPVGGDLLSGS